MNCKIAAALMALLLILPLPCVISAAGEKILIYCHDELGGVHRDAVTAGIAMFKQFGQANGFSIDTTKTLAPFTIANLANYAAIAFLDASDTSHPSATDSQKEAFQAFIQSGKGFIGLHCLERNFLDWPWYHEMIGLSYVYDDGYASMAFHVVDTANPLSKGIPLNFSSQQQLRVDSVLFADTSQEFTVLVKSDSQSNKNISGYTGSYRQSWYPYIWTRVYNGAHLWCGLMGHLSATFSTDTAFRKLMLNGILYALNRSVQPGPAAPTLASPTNGSGGTAASLTLCWNSSAGATTYAVQVSTTSTFSTSVTNQIGLSSTSLALSGLGSMATYFWHALASSTSGSSAWSAVWSFTPGLQYAISLAAGWNMVSLNFHPFDSSASAVFGTDTGAFLFVKDIAGNQYCPKLSLDQIHLVQTIKGYQIYTAVPDTITATGTPVSLATTPLALSAGWNLIAFLPQSSDSVTHALADITSSVLLIKDNLGSAYCPSYGVNDLFLLNVGQGYKICMTSEATLTYPDPLGLSKSIAPTAGERTPWSKLRHFVPRTTTDNNASLIARRVVLDGASACDGSEVGAFDRSGHLVGAGRVEQGRVFFPVWGDDLRTSVKEGCALSEKIAFRLWDGKREYPLDFEADNSGDGSYSADALLVGTLRGCVAPQIAGASSLTAYPNPFKAAVKIGFDIPATPGADDRVVQLDLFDMNGSLVEHLAEGKYPAGHHEVVWNGGWRSHGSSIFIVRMKSKDFDKRLKVIRAK